MIRRIDLADTREIDDLLSLQHASYRVEADLIGSEAIPPLHDTVRTLQVCGETFYGYVLGASLAGAIAYKRDGELLDIHRLMVHPHYFRRGIARALLQKVLTVESDASRAIVQTGSLNAPAHALYLREGFTAIGEREVAPGLRVTQFERRIDG